MHPRQEAQAASLTAQVAALRCAESRLTAELGSLQAQLAEARRDADQSKRALAAARDAEQERLAVEVYPLLRASYILRAAAAGGGDGQGGSWSGLPDAELLRAPFT